MRPLRASLLDLWRARIHPAASRQQVAAAFALVAGGVVLAILGVLVVSVGDVFLSRPSWLREVGFMAAASGLPVFLMGLLVGLPSSSWVKGMGVAGLLASLAGIAIFGVLYPDRWHVTVQTPNAYALGAYLLGVSALAASATAALASHMIERARSSVSQSDPGEPDPVTEEEIQADLAWASEQGWDWGGVPQRREDTRVQLKPEDEAVSFAGGGDRFVLEETSDPQTEEAVQALTRLRGTKDQATDEAVGDQVGHLRRLQEQKRAEEEAKRSSLWWKLRHPIQWWRGS